MNIGSLNFNLRQMAPLNFKGKNTNNTASIPQTKCDTFVKSAKNNNPFDGQMSYKTYEAAKKTVTKSLGYTPQKESAVLVQGDKIVHFEEGEERCVLVEESLIENLAKNSPGKIIYIHSHPNTQGSSSLPLSMNDFLCLYTNDNLSAMCSIDEKGEYSILKKKPGFEKDLEKLTWIEHQLNVAFAEAFDGEVKEEYLKYLEDEESVLNGDYDKIDEVIKKASYFTDILVSADAAGILDNFWRNCAEEYGLEYISSYGS